jgi:hypothetical protein
LSSIEALYTFREREDVLNFLDNNSFLIPLLIETQAKIETYFPQALLFLEVFADPDSMDDVKLVLLISTNLAPRDAVVTLRRLDKEWWIKELDRGHQKLVIEVESQVNEL